MANRVGRWGGSLSVRIPKNIVELMGIREKDLLHVRLCDDNTIQIRMVTPAPRGSSSHAAISEPEEPTEW